MVLFILLGSTAFSLVFRGLGGDRFMFDFLSNLPGGQIGFLIARAPLKIKFRPNYGKIGYSNQD
jgi:TRAP-type mannitol/chloroaromatic compound transport system permease large subunit